MTVVLAAISTSLLAHPVTAQSTSHDASFSVTNPVGEYTVKPGQKLTHSVVVGIGAGSPEPVEVLADARGLGQAPDGATLALLSDQDSSPQSARPFMTADPQKFTLQPGSTRTVVATIEVPQDASKAVYYADLYVHTAPTGTQRVGIIRAAHIPILLTMDGHELQDRASITSFEVQSPQAGEPIQLTSTLKNIGEHHFKTNATFDIRPAGGGGPLATQVVPFSGSSLLPTFARDIRATFSFLDRLQGLPIGDYLARVTFNGPNGQLLDSREARFHLSELYLPFPGIDPGHLKVVRFNDEEPGVVDARAEANTLLRFSGTGKVSGTLVIGKFAAEPRGTPFGIDLLDGGTGKHGVKFVGVGVQGFSQGQVHVNVLYRDDELNLVDPNTFLLSVRSGLAGHWVPLDNLVVQTGARNVAGDSSVALLNSAPTFGMGGDQKAGLAALPAALWVGGAGLLALAAGAGGFVGARRRSAGGDSEDEDEDDNKDEDE